MVNLALFCSINTIIILINNNPSAYAGFGKSQISNILRKIAIFEYVKR